MSVSELKEYTFKSKYAKWVPEKKRRETWNETIDRFCDMFLNFYTDKKDVFKYIERVRKSLKQKKVLGSQRGLQFGGKPILDKNARIFNCFGIETEFISSEGVKSFYDCYDGQELTVLTHTGSWKRAVVKNFGKQQLNKITFKKSNTEFSVRATENHRWLLSDGSETTSLSVGDRLLKQKSIFENFDYDSATPEEKLYWCYGFVYGDGTITNNNYSMVRLCGDDIKYEYRFKEVGFTSTSSLSLDGDIICFTGRYKKTSPDPQKDSPELIRAFTRGYLDADGTKSRNKDGKLFINIQSSEKDHIDFIRKCFPIAGVYIISEKDLTGQETNFGVRPYTILFTICDKPDTKTSSLVSVKSISKDEIENVWCLQVEDDHSFVLPNGIPTGNCIFSYADRPEFFQECMYLLMCGCGTGFSVQTHHVDKLPEVVSPTSDIKKVYIEDSLEGWADAIGDLVKSYFKGYDNRTVEFSYEFIRSAGSRLNSSSGKAPGPEPLRKAIENIRKILNNSSNKLKPIEVYDIVMHFADAVISGGVRRSATICLFSKDDLEMRNAKTGNWFYENPQRGRSNNSVILLRNETTFEEFAEIIKSVKEFGEPGFVWADDLESGFNPCVTEDTLIHTSNGLRTVKSLVSNKFTAVVDGELFNSKSNGFWKTGNKEVLELEFKSGRKIKVTENHKIMTTSGWVEAKDIDFNHDVVINNHRKLNIHINEQSINYSRGYLLGSFIGDGNISGEASEVKFWGINKDIYRQDAIALIDKAGWLSIHHKITNSDSNSIYSLVSSRKLYKYAEERGCLKDEIKQLSIDALECDYNELSGIIAGYFDADGGVNFNESKGHSLRIGSSVLKNLENLQIALNVFGIFSTIYKNRRDAGYRLLPDGKGGYKEYLCQDYHELVISCDNILRFKEFIKIRNLEKLQKLNLIIDSYCRLPNRTNFTDKIVNKKFIGKHDVYDAEIESIHAFDANSIYVHNCVEINLYAYDKNGNSGWQGCNLSTVNCGKVKTKRDFYKACVDAAIIGTLQAGFTNFPYLGKVTEDIFKREALLGVSMTGVMDAPDICLDPVVQKRGAELVKKTNKIIAKIIGINQAARTTCLKPEGTSSCILGTASGIHPHHSKRYIRRVQANKTENVYNHFRDVNPLACESSVWSNNDTDDVIAFTIEVPDGAKLKNQLSAIDLLSAVKSTQENWVSGGKNEDLCVKPWLNHNVSNTITVKPDEWDDVTKFIYDNRKYFCGISLLPLSGDKDYPQAPFTSVYLPSEMFSEYGDAALFASGLIVEAKQLYDDNLWKACDSLLGIGEKARGKTKLDWVERCKKYADKYCDGNLKALTYCLKDVDNYKLYTDLKREYKKVDYTQLIEEENNVKVEQELACSGGACSL